MFATMGTTEMIVQYPRVPRLPVSVYAVNIFGVSCISQMGTALTADEKRMDKGKTSWELGKGIMVNHRVFQGEGVAASFCSRLLQASSDYRDKPQRSQQMINNVPKSQIFTRSFALLICFEPAAMLKSKSSQTNLMETCPLYNRHIRKSQAA